MKRENILKQLEKRGYTVEFGRFGRWDCVPYANGTAIAGRFCVNGTQGIRTEFKLNDVLDAIADGWGSVGDYLEHQENLAKPGYLEWYLKNTK